MQVLKKLLGSRIVSETHLTQSVTNKLPNLSSVICVPAVVIKYHDISTFCVAMLVSPSFLLLEFSLKLQPINTVKCVWYLVRNIPKGIAD